MKDKIYITAKELYKFNEFIGYQLILTDERGNEIIINDFKN